VSGGVARENAMEEHRTRLCLNPVVASALAVALIAGGAAVLWRGMHEIDWLILLGGVGFLGMAVLLLLRGFRGRALVVRWDAETLEIAIGGKAPVRQRWAEIVSLQEDGTAFRILCRRSDPIIDLPKGGLPAALVERLRQRENEPPPQSCQSNSLLEVSPSRLAPALIFLPELCGSYCKAVLSLALLCYPWTLHIGGMAMSSGPAWQWPEPREMAVVYLVVLAILFAQSRILRDREVEQSATRIVCTLAWLSALLPYAGVFLAPPAYLLAVGIYLVFQKRIPPLPPADFPR
jgi:hypothetical protein